MAVGLVDRPVRSQPPAPVRRGLLARRPDRPDPEQERLRRLDGTRALLERARALVAEGWVQDAFYVVRGRHGETRPVSPLGLLLLSRTDVVGACLVGAVAHSSTRVDRRDRHGQAALAVDLLWEALAGGPVDTPHPAARSSRVRDLARWNDQPGRSREDVLDLMDRAVSRTAVR
jgi:hypothetical protein